MSKDARHVAYEWVPHFLKREEFTPAYGDDRITREGMFGKWWYDDRLIAVIDPLGCVTLHIHPEHYVAHLNRQRIIMEHLDMRNTITQTTKVHHGFNSIKLLGDVKPEYRKEKQ